MTYAFQPLANAHERSYAYWQGAFKYEELEKIIALGESLEVVPGKVADETEHHEIRHSKISWIKPNDESLWIFRRIADIMQKLNAQCFGFDLWGFVDALQYTVYDAALGDQHYDWHIDANGKGQHPRKLSASIQLSDPMDYEGGELWVHGFHREALPKQRGMIHVFPSYTLHRVTPVTKGVRRSLVAWASGPEFR